MCGKAQRDNRPAIELIETSVLLFSSCRPNYACNAAFRLTASCCNKMSAITFVNVPLSTYCKFDT